MRATDFLMQVAHIVLLPIAMICDDFNHHLSRVQGPTDLQNHCLLFIDEISDIKITPCLIMHVAFTVAPSKHLTFMTV